MLTAPGHKEPRLAAAGNTPHRVDALWLHCSLLLGSLAA